MLYFLYNKCAKFIVNSEIIHMAVSLNIYNGKKNRNKHYVCIILVKQGLM